MTSSGVNGNATKRSVRIANCSGSASDPGVHMLTQALHGDVDFITGDYLAEINLAQNAEATKAGTHPGWIPTALDGLTQSLEVLNEKRIKVIINGGALNPKGLAEKVQEMVTEKSLNLKVAYVSGDALMDRVHDLLSSDKGIMAHLDSENPKVHLAEHTTDFLDDARKPIVSANAYLGARAIVKGLEEGADIIICGRVSDASPVIGAAQWWFGWSETDYDELAGSLIAGHLIECSTYSTGANFAGFDAYPINDLLDLGLPITEIDSKGECVITKAKGLKGIVTTDVITCQLLYELQGDIYLNSDVKADISNIAIVQQGENRVHVSGVKGYPPPPTTKFAVFYRGGYQCELTVNASGYASEQKFDLFEAQLTARLKEWGALDQIDILEFQRCGIREPNPHTQLASTTYCRIFAQAVEAKSLYNLLKATKHNGMQHYSGMHCSMDQRTAVPQPYLGFYPAILPQSLLSESATILSPNGPKTIASGHPPTYEALAPRRNYDPTSPAPLSSFGPTIRRPLGDIALARSGDKGANINVGFFVHTDAEYEWLRAFLTRERMALLMGDDWRAEYWVERVEFVKLKAVHFVIYGPLGRGVSSSARLDNLAKGFADFIRDRVVDVPRRFLPGRKL